MAASWRVIADVEREELTTGGQFRPVRVITFELLDTGRSGTVTVDARNYTAEFVSSAIQQYADQIADVGNLTA